MWEKETIPDTDKLFFFIHINSVKYDKEGNNPFVPESSLTNTPETGHDKSSDWSKYHSPKETRDLRGKEYKFNQNVFKRPEEYFIYSTRVIDWRSIDQPHCKQSVEHDLIYNDPVPLGKPNNRAHAIIIGEKNDLKLRTLISRCINWEIAPPSTKTEIQKMRKDMNL